MTARADRIASAQLTAGEFVDWRHRARCRDCDPELFFPVGTTAPAETQAAKAIAVCNLCPVQATCRNYAIAARTRYGLSFVGVWGGFWFQETTR